MVEVFHRYLGAEGQKKHIFYNFPLMNKSFKLYIRV
jgi:hypothetical protein